MRLNGGAATVTDKDGTQTERRYDWTAEHLTVNQRVTGLSPVGIAKN